MAEWRSFEAIAPDLPQNQRDDMRRAFFAGAGTLLDCVSESRRLSKHQLKFVLMAFEEQIEAFIKEEAKRARQVVLARITPGTCTCIDKPPYHVHGPTCPARAPH